ncbi:hypothetical protein [Sutcliffiella sp. NC1]|uniref:hypothetical protein n=1 Tax=Sutcliffiella sp. NC1 TaxID=3004096 RepID=UPI0022DE0017|nr:hypothetical protein [Sutcliffiella sp. NC1]WBL16352.1 hypothetical protein O1A01_06890 [Sutcliffiella sp. NC1]
MKEKKKINVIDEYIREFTEPLLETTRMMLDRYEHPIEIFRTNLLIADVLEDELGLDIDVARRCVGLMVKEILAEYENNQEWVNGLIALEESKGD